MDLATAALGGKTTPIEGLKMKSGKINSKMSVGISGRQGGWAMMETLIALIIGLVVLAGAFVLVQMAFSSNTISQAQQDLMTTKANISRLFNNQSDFAAISNQIATQSGLVPSSMIVGDTASGDITNAFGGNVTIVPDDGNGAGLAAAAGITIKADSYYSITFTGVPQEACIQMGSYTRSQWAGGVEINGTSIDVFTNGAAPVVTQVNNACNNAQNEMLFVHR